ncbi:MIP domain containing protein, partial [Asbolus verrucosus]
PNSCNFAKISSEVIVSGKKIKLNDNTTVIDKITFALAEFFGTAILMFLGCMGCVNIAYLRSAMDAAIAFGLAVLIAIQCFGHISGAHINPIITVAATMLGYLPLIQAPVYILSQILGAIVGFALLHSVTQDKFILGPGDFPGVCSPMLNPNITEIQGFVLEFSISFILVLVCCGVWDRRNAVKTDSIPIRFGLTIAGLALAGGPYTGAHMNPARSLAPALLNNDWNTNWVRKVVPEKEK